MIGLTKKQREAAAKIDAANGVRMRRGIEAATELARDGRQAGEPPSPGPLTGGMTREAIAEVFEHREALRDATELADDEQSAADAARRALCFPPFMRLTDTHMKLLGVDDGVEVTVDRPGDCRRHGLIGWQEIATEAWGGPPKGKPPRRKPPLRGSRASGSLAAPPPRPAASDTADDAAAGHGARHDGEPPSAIDPQTMSIDLKYIDPNPWQPRQDFAAADLQSLAGSLQADGQLQPIVVRLTAVGRYQIADGERRLRAAKLASWEMIRCEVRRISDREMARFAMIANLERKQLNPIEQARALKALRDEHGYSQEQLGADFGLGDQSAVSIKLRLLDLPEAWRSKIAAADLSVSHARILLPFVAYPQILAKILKELDSKHNEDGQGQVGSLNRWREEVRWIVRRHGESLDNPEYEPRLGGLSKPLRPTDEQIARLDVVELPTGRGGVERVALNTKLFGTLWEAHVKAQIAARDAKADKGARQAAAEKRSLSPAEAKRKAAERRRQLENRIVEWKDRWIRWLVSEALEELDGHSPIFPALALFLAAQGGPRIHYSADAFNALEVALGIKSNGESVAALAELRRSARTAGKFAPAIADTISAWLKFDPQAERPSHAIDTDDLVEVADWLAIDLAAEWRGCADRPGADFVAREWLALHDKDALAAMAARLQVDVRFCPSLDRAKKSELVAELSEWPALLAELPASIASSEPWPSAAKAKVTTKGTKGTKKKAKARP